METEINLIPNSMSYSFYNSLAFNLLFISLAQYRITPFPYFCTVRQIFTQMQSVTSSLYINLGLGRVKVNLAVALVFIFPIFISS